LRAGDAFATNGYRAGAEIHRLRNFAADGVGEAQRVLDEPVGEGLCRKASWL
jgi:hypothetical protein